jgi:hypothetical protein
VNVVCRRSAKTGPCYGEQTGTQCHHSCCLHETYLCKIHICLVISTLHDLGKFLWRRQTKSDLDDFLTKLTALQSMKSFSSEPNSDDVRAQDEKDYADRPSGRESFSTAQYVKPLLQFSTLSGEGKQRHLLQTEEVFQ